MHRGNPWAVHRATHRSGRPTCLNSEVACPSTIHRQIEFPIFLMKTTLAHQLADYTCAQRFEDLSKEVVHEVKRRVIDSLGCALGAWKEEPFVIARKVAADFSAAH